MQNSEQELKKWANKYRLYRILHGITGNLETHLLFSACSLCPYHLDGVHPWYKRRGENCPKDSLMMDIKKRGIFVNINPSLNWADWCMEWVKHV